MEDVLFYGLLFAVLLTAGALIRRPLDRALQADLLRPDPGHVDADGVTGYGDAGSGPFPNLWSTTFTIPTIVHVDDLRDLPLAQPRPFDRCWPGTDEPKAGL